MHTYLQYCYHLIHFLLATHSVSIAWNRGRGYFGRGWDVLPMEVDHVGIIEWLAITYN